MSTAKYKWRVGRVGVRAAERETIGTPSNIPGSRWATSRNVKGEGRTLGTWLFPVRAYYLKERNTRTGRVDTIQVVYDRATAEAWVNAGVG
jgi:hypothetical protein